MDDGEQFGTPSVICNGKDGANGGQGIQGIKGDTGSSGVNTVFKSCTNSNAKVTRLFDGTLLTNTYVDGMTTLAWASSGSSAPSYRIGGNSGAYDNQYKCTVYVD